MSDTIERRVQRLERINLGLVITLGLVLTVGAVQVAKVPKEVRAERFVVVDAEGESRISMDTGRPGSYLEFLDGKGRSMITLKATDKIAELSVAGPAGNGRVDLYSEKDSSSVVLSARKSGPRIMLSVDGETQFQAFWDKDGTMIKPQQADPSK